jgi:hypothetical protein
MSINGRNLADLIAAKVSAGRTSAPALTRREGAFGQDAILLDVDLPIGKVLLHPSPDWRWHVQVAHEKDDQVSVIADAGRLMIAVKPKTSQGNAFASRSASPTEDHVFIRQTSISVGSVSIVNGMVSGGSAALVEIQLPLGPTYQAELQTAAGDVLLNPETLAFFRLTAKTGSGRVSADLGRATVEAFRAHTGAGDVAARLPTTANCRVDLSTGLGDIDLVLGRNLAISLAASTGLGDRLILHPDLGQVSAGHWQSRGGTIRLEIRATTGAGDIKVGG